MQKLCIIMLTVFVMASCSPVPKQSPLGGFEQKFTSLLADFGNRLAADLASDEPGAPRIEELVNAIMNYLTELGNTFLRALEQILIDIFISLWENPRPAEEVLKELEDRIAEEFTKFIWSLYELISYLENIFGPLKNLASEFHNAVTMLITRLIEEVIEVYRIVEEVLASSSMIDWLIGFFNLQVIAWVLYDLPLSILHALIQVSTQLLFASQQVLIQAQAIFDTMVQQILHDINNAANYVWNAITALSLLPGIGK